MALTFLDVERLSAASSPRERIDVAGKVAENFARHKLTGRQKDVAIEIFRLLLRDAEMKVRETLGHHLRTSIDLPKDIAFALARDVDSVAVPILEFTGVLDEDDLIDIVETVREVDKLAAIARRAFVPFRLSKALLRHPQAQVAAALFSNRGAHIEEVDILSSVEHLANEESVIDALVARGNLPLSCVERIFTIVSVEMKRKLAARYHISRHLIEGKMEYAREWATLESTRNAGDENIEALVRELLERRKLTSSMLVRALCVGDLRFFEYALAALVGLSADNVRQLMQDRGERGFSALYRLSPLPPAYYEAVKKLLDITLNRTQYGRVIPEDFSHLVVDDILAHGYDKSVEYMPLLLAIIQGGSHDFKRLH